VCADWTAVRRPYATPARSHLPPTDADEPSLRQLPQLQAVEDDILLNTSYTQRFHVLRAANILNRAYFDTATLERMVCNLRSRLLPAAF